MKNRGFGKKKAGLLLCLSLLLFTGCGEGQAAGGTGLDSGSAQAEAGGTVQESTPAGAGGMVQNGSAPQEGVPTESGSAVNGSVPQESVPAEAGGSALQESASAEAGGTGADDSITLIMVGDILLHTPVAESGKTKDGEYDFSAIFAPLKEEIQSADIAIVNQEVIIGGAELGVSGYPAFNAPYELGDALVEAGFDVVCQGTNHALDKGKKGILNCISYWREEHPEIAVLGIHDSEEAASSVYIREEDGFRIAILNYTYGTNGVPLPEGMPYAVELLDKEKVAADLKEAEEKADKKAEKKEKKAKKKKRAGTVVLLVLVALLLIVVLLFVYYMTQVAGNPQISLRSEEPSSTQQTEATPTPTPSQTEETQPSVTPSPSPSPTPIDPALLPFIEGTAEQSAATDFVPAKNRRIVAEEEGQQTIWITGRAPSAATKILVAQFVYDEVNQAAVGGVYGYYQDDQGNLRYASMEEGGSDLLMLPAECVVGAKFSGMLGASRVYAVNYSGTISGVKMKDAVVVSCESGYAFYEKGKGLVLIQSDFDSGDVLYRIVSDDPDNKGIYSEYVD